MIGCSIEGGGTGRCWNLNQMMEGCYELREGLSWGWGAECELKFWFSMFGLVVDLLVKVGKFIFIVDFVVLDMKEDKDLPIILGRPFLNTARAVVDIHDSKLTLHVEDEEITFEMDQEVNNEEPLVQMLEVNDVDGKRIKEDPNKLNEIEKMMEEELKA